AEGFDERLLGEVLRERAVARHARDQRDDRPLIAADNLLERRLRARTRLDEEPGLAYRFQIDRDGRSSLELTRQHVSTLQRSGQAVGPRCADGNGGTRACPAGVRPRATGTPRSA